MARILKGFHSFTCTPCVHLLMVLTIPAFAFPAETGTYLPTLEGWKAELVCLDPAVGFSELLAELISPAKQVLGV